MPLLNAGSQTIFSSSVGSTAAVGEWWTISPTLERLSVQALLTASSVGATAGSTIRFEVSNTTLATSNSPIIGRTCALTCTTDTVSDGGALVSTMVASWRFIRAVLVSLTTSTDGSAGSPAVIARVNAGSVR